jgi:crotonobetainyl-CoA:carnitine CoA-transferase CaiB-like acyl-CoA transferase
VYPSAGDDRWVAIAVADDADWDGLRAALGWPADPALATAAGRLAAAAQDAVDARLAEWTRARSPEEAAEVLQEHGVSAMPVMGPRDHHADPHLAARGAIVRLHHPEVGPERQIANPTRWSRLATRVAASAPCLGADTEAVLAELGLDAAEVAALRESGVCR